MLAVRVLRRTFASSAYADLGSLDVSNAVRNGVQSGTSELFSGRGSTFFIEEVVKVEKKEGIDVLYENDDFCFVYKPANLTTSGDDDNDAVDLHHKVKAYMSQYMHHPALLHRLDKITSGVMCFGVNKRAERYFQNTILIDPLAHRLTRDYVAIVRGIPPSMEGSVKGGIVKDPNNLKRWKVTNSSANGKKVSCQYKVIATEGEGPKRVSAVFVRIAQGRTHQVRASLKHLNCPIVGDVLYERMSEQAKLDEKERKKMEKKFPVKEKNFNAKLPIEAGRSFLHAARLCFVDGRKDDSYYCISAPLPDFWVSDFPNLAAKVKEMMDGNDDKEHQLLRKFADVGKKRREQARKEQLASLAKSDDEMTAEETTS